MTSIAFGPVPSRRLGGSLGINNIPPKSCGYACVYCLLSITLVHPMRGDAVAELLAKAGEGWGRTFFVRCFARPAAAGAAPGRMA